MNTQMNHQRITVDQLKLRNIIPTKASSPVSRLTKRSCNSPRYFGYVATMVWNEVTGYIVSGYQCHKVLAAKGKTEIDCMTMRIENPQEKKGIQYHLEQSDRRMAPVALADLLVDL